MTPGSCLELLLQGNGMDLSCTWQLESSLHTIASNVSQKFKIRAPIWRFPLSMGWRSCDQTAYCNSSHRGLEEETYLLAPKEATYFNAHAVVWTKWFGTTISRIRAFWIRNAHDWAILSGYGGYTKQSLQNLKQTILGRKRSGVFSDQVSFGFWSWKPGLWPRLAGRGSFNLPYPLLSEYYWTCCRWV